MYSRRLGTCDLKGLTLFIIIIIIEFLFQDYKFVMFATTLATFLAPEWVGDRQQSERTRKTDRKKKSLKEQSV